MQESKITEQMKKLTERLKLFGVKIKEKTKQLTEQVKVLGKKAGGLDLETIQATHHKFTKKIVNKKRFYATVSAFALVLIVLIFIFFSGSAYALHINGVDVGKVRSQKTVQAAVEQLRQEYKATYKAEVSFDNQIKYTKTRASGKNIMTAEELKQTLKKNLQVTVASYAIYVNGNKVAVLKNAETAKNILDTVKDFYLKGIDTTKLKEISFAEKVETKQEFNPIAQIMENSEAAAFILKGTSEVKTHKIESGESFWTISRRYKMSVEALVAANPGANPDKVKIGQVISLIVPKPLISVKTVETVKYIDKVAFDQKVEFNDSLYKTETNVKVKGEYGEKEVVADVTKINGIESDRKLVVEKQTKAPKAQVLVKGTKEPPPKKGTGVFSMPTNGSLSSRFGFRWGRRHEGIDIAAATGTAVKASDGGTVIFVGRDGGYGNLVKIDHGAGYVSYYGHLSKFYVKKGQKVFKGQKIAAVGSTGNSTGPHLHFEIRKNGVAQNPLKYVNK